MLRLPIRFPTYKNVHTSTNQKKAKPQINLVLDTGANVNVNAIKKEPSESLNLPIVIHKDSLVVMGQLLS